MKFGSLCSGIGGLDRGLELAGLDPVWQCEVDPYRRRVLAAHWPGIPCYPDLRELPNDVPPVDLIAAGYPCQPFSYSGKRGGEDDPRHLWPAVRSAIRRIRPRYVLIENVPGHLTLGFDSVLSDLASLGFDAEWSLLSACSLGAPHSRERLFCLAYPPGGHGPDHLSRHIRQARKYESRGGGSGSWGGRWLPEPPMGRVAHGAPSWLVRAPLEALGNAVVPQVGEWIGRMVLAAEGGSPST